MAAETWRCRCGSLFTVKGDPDDPICPECRRREALDERQETMTHLCAGMEDLIQRDTLLRRVMHLEKHGAAHIPRQSALEEMSQAAIETMFAAGKFKFCPYCAEPL